MHLLLCGNGYLGQAAARLAREKGWTVTTVSRSGASSSLAADLSSAASIRSLALRIPAPDAILHCASSGRGGGEAYRAVYLDGCRHLLETFPRIPLLFTSSTSVYAQTDGSLVTESSPALPDRETGLVLRETEDLVLRHGGLVTRLSGIYGPGRSVILRKFLSGEAVIEEDGRRFLNQIHRDDAASALVHLLHPLDSPASGIFNVSDSTPLSQLDTYLGLSRLFSRPLPPTGPRDLQRKRGWTHKQVGNGKLLQSGWSPAYPGFLDAALDLAPTLDLEPS